MTVPGLSAGAPDCEGGGGTLFQVKSIRYSRVYSQVGGTPGEVVLKTIGDISKRLKYNMKF